MRTEVSPLLASVLSHLTYVRPRLDGRSADARCPTSGDHDLFVYLDEGGRRVSLECGRSMPCTLQAIITAAGIDAADLSSKGTGPAPRLVPVRVAKVAAGPPSPVPPRPVPAQSGPPMAASMDAADLLALDLPPLLWIVPNLLPEGTTVLAAAPKVGKSCLVYQIAVEVALGGSLFGRRAEPGAALYLALEDGMRRGQDRLRAALANRTMPHGRLEVRWGARKIGEGLEEDLTEWLDARPDARLVAIDTLARVRPGSNGKRNAYEVDVEDLGRLQSLFRDRRCALLIVHHTNQARNDDLLERVSGTSGITGSVDTIALIRRKRLEVFGSIVVLGRDVAEAEIPVRFDGMTWTDAPVGMTEASFERAEVYRWIEEQGPLFPAAIAKELGLMRQSVQQMCTRMVEQGSLVRVVKGYVVAPNGSRPTAKEDDQ